MIMRKLTNYLIVVILVLGCKSVNDITKFGQHYQKYQKELIITEDEREYYELFDGPPKFIKEIGPEWQRFDFFNSGLHRSKPASTGLTLLRRNA